MPFSFIQTAFNGGELSRRLRGRVDSELYKKGLSFCENWEPTPQGSLRMRNGTHYAALLAAGLERKLEHFRILGSSGYEIEFIPFGLKIYDADARIAAPGTEVIFRESGVDPDLQLVSDPSFESPPHSSWVASSGVVFGSGSVNIPTNGTIQQRVMTPVSGSHSLYVNHNHAHVVTVKVGTTQGGDEVLTERDARYSVNVVVPDGVLPATLWITVKALGGCDIYSVEFWPDVPADRIAAPWSAVSSIRTIMDSSQDAMIILSGNARPQLLKRTLDEFGRIFWTLHNIEFVGQPAMWNLGWPTVGEIHQGRLWLGATSTQPSDLWGSRPGEFFNFDTGGSDAADDAMAITLRAKGRIRGVLGHRALLIATDIGEFSVTSQGPVIWAGDFEIRQESSFGSAALPMTMIGSQPVYASLDAKKLRALTFSTERDNWGSVDLTFIAEHITSAGIKEIHFARDPNGSILLLFNDGTLACCTYEREAQVAAWWRFTTVGTVETCSVTDGPAGSVLWLSVARATGTFLEWFKFGEEATPVFADCAIVRATEDDAEVGVHVSGLYHLAGAQVRVICGGIMQPNQIVDQQTFGPGSGIVLTPEVLAGIQSVVGLPYAAKATMLSPEVATGRGTSQGAKKRWTKATVRLSDSVMPLLNGRRPNDRTPATVLDAAEPRRDGDYVVTPDHRYDDGKLDLEQDIPMRTEILAVFGSLDVNEV